MKYQKNKYNIGGNANIVKAFYKASKDYVWVLADNDDYSWESWKQVEQGVIDNNDAIIVAVFDNPRYDVATLFIQATFLPGVIYKTSLIDDTVMGNMEFNISNMFPHLALSSKLINEDLKISCVDNSVVINGDNYDENGEYEYTRGYQKDSIHPLQRDMNWFTGYANSLHMIKDKKTRNYIIRNNKCCAGLNSAQAFYFNKKESNGSIYNMLSIFSVLNWSDKVRFLLNMIFVNSLYLFVYIHVEKRFVNNNTELQVIWRMKLFNCIKTNLFKYKKKLKRIVR